MNSKFIHAKYLAVVLLGIVFLVLASVDAFSQSEINISGPDTFVMNTSALVEGKTIKAHINVVKTLRSKNYNLNNCTFKVDLNATSENYSARCMEAVVKLFVVDRREVVNGDTQERFINLDLDFAAISDLAALKHGLAGLEFSDGLATFETADLSQAQNFSLRVKVSADRLLLKDKVIINRDLAEGDYTIEKLPSGKARISIDLNRLSDDVPYSKDPTLKVELKALKPVNLKDAINTPVLANALSASLIIND